MGRDLELECKCGALHGLARDVSGDTVNRVICLCIDCQTFAHHLGRADLLDEHGGSDVIQVAPASLTYDKGTEKIAAVRLGPKGPYRWYATCCKTPLGNTIQPSVPFVGILPELFVEARDPARRDDLFGPPRAAINGKDAIGEPPPGSVKTNLRFLGHTIVTILGWKLRGRSWPHPYFERSTGEPRFPVQVLTREEREAARGSASAGRETRS